MSRKSSAPPTWVLAEELVRDVRRSWLEYDSAQNKIRSVLKGLRCE